MRKENNNQKNNSNSLTNSNNLLNIKKEDLREKIRKQGIKIAITVAVDMSGSMISEDKLNKIKLILQKIIDNIQLNKDKLAVVGFKGKKSEVIIPPSKRPKSFLNNLGNISVGGTTPMAVGLEKALEISITDAKDDEEYLPIIFVLSDGVTNVSLINSTRENINKKYSQDIDKNKLKNKENFTKNNTKKLISNPINDVLAIGEEIAKNDIHTVIINFEKEKNKGRSINKELAFVTNGRFYDLEKLAEIANEQINSYDSSKNPLTFSSFKSDLSDLVIDEILNFERDNI